MEKLYKCLIHVFIDIEILRLSLLKLIGQSKRAAWIVHIDHDFFAQFGLDENIDIYRCSDGQPFGISLKFYRKMNGKPRFIQLFVQSFQKNGVFSLYFRREK
jgi:hypothetical protein